MIFIWNNIWFFRLDFDTFLSAGTRQVGNGPFSCLDDSFTVITPSNEEVPTICGFNSGQHSK